jgi:3-oxoadipate enol-lactonase
MAVLRFLGNLFLALILVLLIAGILFLGYSVMASRTWETADLGDGVESGEWLWLEGRPFYYRAAGPEQGPALVLVHDFAVEGLEAWGSEIWGLAKSGIRVIAVDLKGFGRSVRDPSPTYTLRSQATVLAQMLNALRLSGATVAGYGWGSAVALQLAYEQPQFVGRLVLIAPRVHEQPRPLWQPVAQVPYLGRAAAWAVDVGGPVWALLRQRDYADPGQFTREERRRLGAPGHIVGTLDALLAMAATPPEDDLPAALRNVGVPTLIILGQNDSPQARQEAVRLSRELADAQVVVIPGAGRAVHREQGAAVNRRLAEFCLGGAR